MWIVEEHHSAFELVFKTCWTRFAEPTCRLDQVTLSVFAAGPARWRERMWIAGHTMRR